MLPPAPGQRVVGAVCVAVVLVSATAVAACSTRDVAEPGARQPPATSEVAPTSMRGLVVRGGPGTGGFLADGDDGQLSDIDDDSEATRNHGWGTFAARMRVIGVDVEQAVEGPGGRPVDLSRSRLDDYGILVLGSNNADYPPEAVRSVTGWVADGGGLLVISDANWGSSWDDAPSSDQSFLTPFDLRMNQDHGAYEVDRESFDAPEHPLLAGIEAFEGEGVSPITVLDVNPEVDPVPLAPARGEVRRPTTGRGPLTPATASDAALVAVSYGSGRVVAYFDRNTFFNRNGAGTDITSLDHARLADNIIEWLAADSDLAS